MTGEKLATRSPSRLPRGVLAAIPLLLIAIMVAAFLKLGPARIFPTNAPPVEDLTIGRIDLQPGRIVMTVTNGGAAPVTVKQVLVDDAFWEYTIEPDATIERLRSASITLEYPWVEEEPINLRLMTSSGVTFDHTIDVAAETPGVDTRFLVIFALLGIYIGLIPVLLGMTARPFLRTLSRRWIVFFMALTAGVLIFLGIETVTEALEQAEALPTAVGGIGVVTLGAIGSFALILAFARWMRARSTGDSRLVVAWLVAGGIGLHNLGEGLAVGAAYRLGEIALGAFLVIGFAIHNTTEGLGIVSILSDKKVSLAALAGLGALAGLPTIAGAWISAFYFSPILAAVFLAIAAGAIAEVTLEVLGVVREEPAGLASPEALSGIAVGIAVMYLTGVFVAA